MQVYYHLLSFKLCQRIAIDALINLCKSIAIYYLLSYANVLQFNIQEANLQKVLRLPTFCNKALCQVHVNG